MAVHDLGYTWVVERATASRRLYSFLLAGDHCPPSIPTTQNWYPSMCQLCRMSSLFSNTISMNAL
nr:hypothetical protein Iba_chr06cCG17330 [Ipomoea batatas]